MENTLISLYENFSISNLHQQAIGLILFIAIIWLFCNNQCNSSIKKVRKSSKYLRVDTSDPTRITEFADDLITNESCEGMESPQSEVITSKKLKPNTPRSDPTSTELDEQHPKLVSAIFVVPPIE